MWFRISFSQTQIENRIITTFQNMTQPFVLTNGSRGSQRVLVFKKINDDDPLEFVLYIFSNSLDYNNYLSAFNPLEVNCPTNEQLGCFMASSDDLSNIRSL